MAVRNYQPTHKTTNNYIDGTRAMEAGDLDVACRHFLKEPPNSPCYNLALGNASLAFVRKGEFVDGEKYAHKALNDIKINGCTHLPSHVQFARNLGEALHGQGKVAEGLDSIKEAIRLADKYLPNHPQEEMELELEKAHSGVSLGGLLLQIPDYNEAIDVYKEVRDVYRKYISSNVVGQSECLTNLSICYTQKGRYQEAEYALDEARQICKSHSEFEQLEKIEISLLQLNGKVKTSIEVKQPIFRLAGLAIKRKNYPLAYLRYCIGAQICLEKGLSKEGLIIIKRAEKIQSKISKQDPNFVKSLPLKAYLLEMDSARNGRIVRTLVVACHWWYKHILEMNEPADINFALNNMHESFRMLSRYYLRKKKAKQALCTFEASRALMHMLEVDDSYVRMFLSKNIFNRYGLWISTSMVTQIQNKMRKNDVMVSLAILPPRITCFVVKKKAVEWFDSSYSKNPQVARDLFQEIILIPKKIASGNGKRSIPSVVFDVANEIKANTGELTISSFSPYGPLHNVPWRSILYELGMPYNKLRFTQNYGMLISAGKRGESKQVKHVESLGYGNAGTLNLEDEAREFVGNFGSEGTFVAKCDSKDVIMALQKQSCVLISCHGMAKNYGHGTITELILKDGAVNIEDLTRNRKIVAPVVILSACESGVYDMQWGDYPVGGAPILLRSGAKFVIGTRFPIGAQFSKDFFNAFGKQYNMNKDIRVSFADTLDSFEGSGYDLWKDMGCLELFSS